MAENVNCDGPGPHTAGEVRVLPHTADPNHGNDILCRACWNQEIRFRRERNRELEATVRFDLPTWEEGQVYGGAPVMTPQRALQILLLVWGNAENLTADLVREVELEALKNENALQTVCRVAGVRYEQTEPFNHARVRQLVAARELELARGE